jgi:hypothetical protein
MRSTDEVGRVGNFTDSATLSRKGARALCFDEALSSGEMQANKKGGLSEPPL